jgi:hypothetical protein
MADKKKPRTGKDGQDSTDEGIRLEAKRRARSRMAGRSKGKTKPTARTPAPVAAPVEMPTKEEMAAYRELAHLLPPEDKLRRLAAKYSKRPKCVGADADKESPF